MRVRPADGAADLDAIVTLNLQVHRLHVAAEPDRFVTPTRDDVAAWFASTLAATAWHVAVADLDGDRLGYVLFEHVDRPASTFTAPIQLVYVHQLGVDAAARRRGIGRALLAYVEAEARGIGAVQVALDTWAFNDHAQAFFASCGYEVSNVRLRRRLHGAADDEA